MAILCNFQPIGIEGKSQRRVVASRFNERRWFGAFDSQKIIMPVKPTTTTIT